MTAFVYVVVYLGVVAFVAGCGVRITMYARMPTHLRWELYPVAHEPRARSEHGGSYYEEGDWWTRRRGGSLAGDFRFMVPEMLFLEGLWRFNRPLWWRSFPFHFGLYLLAASLVLLVAYVLAPDTVAGGTVGAGLRLLYRTSGFAGCLLAFGGACGLLHRRLTDPELHAYTNPGDLVNLGAFLAVLGTLAAGYLQARFAGVGVAAVARGILTFATGTGIPPLLGLGLVMAAVLAAYVPTTHMSHFIAKYFTYHSVRWDDRPAGGNRRLQERFAEYLTYRPTWVARHIGADGERTWAEIAAENPWEASK